MSATTLAVEIWKKRFDKALSRIEHAQTALYRDERKQQTIALKLSPRRLATVHRITDEAQRVVDIQRTDGQTARADELDEDVVSPCQRLIRAGGKASITIERALAIIAFVVRQYAEPVEGSEPIEGDDERKDRAELVSKLDKAITDILDPSQKKDDTSQTDDDRPKPTPPPLPKEREKPAYMDALSDGYELAGTDEHTPAPEDHGRNLNPGREIDDISDDDMYELDD